MISLCVCACVCACVYRYEKIFAGFAYANLCVSEAMKKDLRESYRVK